MNKTVLNQARREQIIKNALASNNLNEMENVFAMCSSYNVRGIDELRKEILRRRGEGKILVILNTQEAKEWVEKNLYEADLYLLPLERAVNTGLLIPIDNGYYVVKETVTNQCTWEIEEVRKLTAEEMAENNLYLPYRFTARVTECPDNYEGAREISAGFDLH